MWYDYNNWSGSTPLTAPVAVPAPPPHPLVFPQGGPPPGGWTWCTRYVRGAQDESLAAATRQESEYSSVELIELLELSSDIASESKASEGCDCVRSIRSRSAHDEV